MLEDNFLDKEEKEPLNIMALIILIFAIVDSFQNELTKAFNFINHFLNF